MELFSDHAELSYDPIYITKKKNILIGSVFINNYALLYPYTQLKATDLPKTKNTKNVGKYTWAAPLANTHHPNFWEQLENIGQTQRHTINLKYDA